MIKSLSLVLAVIAALIAQSAVGAAAPANSACKEPSDSSSITEVFDYADCKEKELAATNDALGIAKLATETAEAKKKANDVEQFFGAGWGIGVGAGFGQGSDRIESASLVNDIVRIDEKVTNSPRLFLETHYFFKTKSARIGHGPFATVNFGANGEDTLTSFGLGWMVGLKRPNSAKSLNIGLGYVLDQGVKKFGSGIREGMPLPAGETEIRFEKESEPAIVLMVSTNF